MPPEPMEIKRWLALCLRESALAPELVLSQALRFALRLFFLEDATMIVLQLPAFPNRWHFAWEVCCDSSRPDGFTQDLGRQKKVHGAIGNA